MNDLENYVNETIEVALKIFALLFGICFAIIILATTPLWIVPYLIYKRIKGSKNDMSEM